MKTIDKLEAYILMKKSNGKFFHAQFIKKNNELREMTCRLGVKKHLRGGELAYDPLAKKLLPVFDVVKKEYRMVNLETMQKLTIESETYLVK